MHSKQLRTNQQQRKGPTKLQNCTFQVSPLHQQIWQRLNYLKSLKTAARQQRRLPPVVGVLGCMAERLKERLLEQEKLVDIVAGPDAYRCDRCAVIAAT